MTAIGSEQVSSRPTRQDRIPLGILYMVVATVLFAGTSAVSKWLVERYPVGEVLFVRAFAALAGTSLVMLPVTGLAVFRTRRLRDHLMRGASQATSQTLLLLAFGMLPLASAIAINFSSPLFATLAAILLLKEPVGAARWAALVLGFIGVLVVAHPGADTFQLGSLYALANAILFGTVTVAVRGMTATESTETLTMYQMATLAAAFVPLLPLGMVTPSFSDGAIMVANGLVNGLGQYIWTRSLHLAPTSAVAPFNYFSLVWAIILGFLIWGDAPTFALLAGSAIVVGSGLFLFWRETRPRRAAAK